MVKEVFEGLKLVSEGIKSVRTIADAVKSGTDYIKNRHPEVQSDLRAMVNEMGKSVSVIKQASAVLTNFRFAISVDTGASELARFNDYYIKSKSELAYLRDHIQDLRSHCSKIREHSQKIIGSTTVEGFKKLFSLLGLNSPKREEELAQQLDKLAYEDFDLANSAERMVNCLEDALKDVQNALGDRGATYPNKVPVAAALLAEYGVEFEKMEENAVEAAKEVRELVEEMK